MSCSNAQNQAVLGFSERPPSVPSSALLPLSDSANDPRDPPDPDPDCLKFGLFEVDAIGDDDDLSHVYLPNFKQL